VELVVDDENNEKQERDSVMLAVEEDSNAALFPGPLLPRGDTNQD
jgi:hypothetical protein